MNSYIHGKYAYQKTTAKYQHCPEARTTSKKPYKGENDYPKDDNTNNVSIKHKLRLSLFHIKLAKANSLS